MKMASFIEIVAKRWNVVNVKTPKGETKLKDDFQTPVLFLEDDSNVEFLCSLVDWLDVWKSKDISTGKLIKDRHRALRQTTRTLVEVATYCFDELCLH